MASFPELITSIYRRHTSLILDAVCLLLLLVNGLYMWPVGAGEGFPAWAGPLDPYLYGPDSASWATNALLWTDGRYAELDYHRLPTWTILTALAMRGGLDAVLAGHFINKAMFLLLPLVLYGLGRLSGSRGAGLGAGLMATANIVIANTSAYYSADPAVMFLIPAMLLSALGAARRWPLALLSGVVAAATSATHYTALAQVVPAALLVLLAGQPGWRRWASFVLHVGVTAGALYVLFNIFPFPGTKELSMIVQGGAETGAPTTRADPNWTNVRTLISQNAATSVEGAVQLLLGSARPAGVPWWVLVVLPWLGIIGLKIEDGRLRTDWKLGLCALLTMGAVPFLIMVNGPARYSYFLLPVVLVLMWRGVAAVFVALDHLASRRVAAWPAGLPLVVVALVIGFWTRSVNEPKIELNYPPAAAIAARTIGTAIATHFPGPGGASVLLREAAIHAGKFYCPQIACPMQATEQAYMACVGRMATECGGTGPIPFVAMTGPDTQFSIPPRPDFAAWIATRWPLVEEVSAGGFTGAIYRIPREDAAAMAGTP